MSRYLITTADERTWKFDQPVVFLGEWCRRYDRKHIWQQMDAVVAEPYGLGRYKKDEDLFIVQDLEAKLFPILCAELNWFHSTEYADRHWKIMLGNWFRRFVDSIYNRIRTLESCFKLQQIGGTASVKKNNYSLAVADTSTGFEALNDDGWSNALYLRILTYLPIAECAIERVEDDRDEFFQSTASRRNQTGTPRDRLIDMFERIFKLFRPMMRNTDGVILNSYLAKKEEIKLQISLGQFPQLYKTPDINLRPQFDFGIRNELSNRIRTDGGCRIFEVLSSLVFELLPSCFLEDYGRYVDESMRLPWPTCPKFIFTSSNFDTDDLFKVYVAAKVKNGSQYVIGQHGSDYGTHRHLFPTVEETVADKFLTWGWTDGLPQHTPAFVLNRVGRKKLKVNSKGGLLLLELCEPYSYTTWDEKFEFIEYFENQLHFVKTLTPNIREALTVRLHSAYVRRGWSEEKRWFDFDPSIRLDTGVAPIRRLMENSRLVVYSYDSTGVLEALSDNIPVIVFLRGGVEHVRDSALDFYRILINAGILFVTAESAAGKINEIWNRVDEWWLQHDVQSARSIFCDRYARSNIKPIRSLKELLF